MWHDCICKIGIFQTFPVMFLTSELKIKTNAQNQWLNVQLKNAKIIKPYKADSLRHREKSLPRKLKTVIGFDIF